MPEQQVMVGQIWRSRDRRDHGRTIEVVQTDGSEDGFTVIRSVFRQSRIRTANLRRMYRLAANPNGAEA